MDNPRDPRRQRDELSERLANAALGVNAKGNSQGELLAPSKDDAPAIDPYHNAAATLNGLQDLLVEHNVEPLTQQVLQHRHGASAGTEDLAGGRIGVCAAPDQHVHEGKFQLAQRSLHGVGEVLHPGVGDVALEQGGLLHLGEELVASPLVGVTGEASGLILQEGDLGGDVLFQLLDDVDVADLLVQHLHHAQVEAGALLGIGLSLAGKQRRGVEHGDIRRGANALQFFPKGISQRGLGCELT